MPASGSPLPVTVSGAISEAIPPLHHDAVLADKVHQAIRKGANDLVRSFQTLESHSTLLQEGRLSERLQERLCLGGPEPLSPWLTLSYYRIGRHLAAGGDGRRLPVSLDDLIHQIEQAPPPGTVLAFGDRLVAPEHQWQSVLELFQEGGDFVADLVEPRLDDYVPLAAAITEVRGLLRAIDAPLMALIDQLLPLAILALPGPQSRNEGLDFGGATSFFFRGGSFIHARANHTLATLLEVIVHEYAHAELFALAQDEHLCGNGDGERHQVRIRSDPRPMNGILHALHVSSRVVAVFDRLLAHGLPWRSDREPLLADITILQDQARSNGLSCLNAALRHGHLTPLGQAITRAAAHRLGTPLHPGALTTAPVDA